MTYRRSLLPPIKDHDVAADLLDRAAVALVSGDIETCATLLIASDLKPLREFAYKVSGPISYEVHRQTKNPVFDAGPKQTTPRMPSALVAREVFRRDGWRCRYCGCRVVSRQARDTFRKFLPREARKGRTNDDNHFGLATLCASIDHVLPFRRGGTNDLVNLVTACNPCQFGKGHWTLDEVELEDPRLFPPLIDGWDGLTRLVGFKSQH